MEPCAAVAERIGSLHGRISRSVEGFFKFLKVVFTDPLPAVLTALFAPGAGIFSEWRIGLVMLAVVPVAIGLTVWQVTSRKGIRRALLQANEWLDGTVLGQLGGRGYIRAANTHRQEVGRGRSRDGAPSRLGPHSTPPGMTHVGSFGTSARAV